MNRKKDIWKALNSKFVILILGFILTTIVGGILTERYNRLAWDRQTAFEIQRQNFEWERERKFEILRRKLDEGQASLEEISDLMNSRFFKLHRVFDNILKRDLHNAQKNWHNYMDTVELWNVKLIIYRNKLTRLVNQEISFEFNNYETDKTDLTNPTSIHGKFFVAHKKVLELLRCLQNPSCQITQHKINDVNETLRDLDYHLDGFVDRASSIFLEQTSELENFGMQPEP